MTKKQRRAPFDLPYKLSGMYCTGALNQLNTDGMLDEFPDEILSKLDQGGGLFSEGVEITQEDIDGLSEIAWEYLKSKLS